MVYYQINVDSSHQFRWGNDNLWIEILYLFTLFWISPKKSLLVGVSGTLEARDGFSELQDGFMCFLKYQLIGGKCGE